jgi:hypothetical protein
MPVASQPLHTLPVGRPGHHRLAQPLVECFVAETDRRINRDERQHPGVEI